MTKPPSKRQKKTEAQSLQLRSSHLLLNYSNIGKPYELAVIYARYSSHSQRDVSIDQQIKECTRYAEHLGLKIVTVYQDRAMTGTNDKRPQFQKMIEDSHAMQWKYVIIYSFDRFARNRFDSAKYKRELLLNGVKVLSATEKIPDEPSGILMEGLLESLNEYYSAELSAKISRGLNDNASKCMVNGAVPLGYKRGADGKYEIVEHEAMIVREIFRRIRDGESQASIISDFNERGIRTKKGKEWNKSSFNTLVSNPRYKGTYIWGDTVIPNGIPVIISEELFDEVQIILGHKKNARKSCNPQRRRQSNNAYLLTGKLFCGHCKSPMTGVAGTGKLGKKYYYYQCKDSRLNHSCNLKPVQQDVIERAVAVALRKVVMNDEIIDALADMALEYQAKNSANYEAMSLQSELTDINRSLGNLLKAIEMGVISETTQNRLLELEEQKKTVTAQLRIAKEKCEKLLTKNEILAVLMLYRDGDIEDKTYQEVLFDAFLISAYVFEDYLEIVFNLGNDEQEVEIPLDIESIDWEDIGVRISDKKLHQSVLYEPQALKTVVTTTDFAIVAFNGLFVMRCLY